MTTLFNMFFLGLYCETPFSREEGGRTIYSCTVPNSLRLIKDRYTGLHIDIAEQTEIPQNLTKLIDILIKAIQLTEEFQSLWVDVALGRKEPYSITQDGFTTFKDYTQLRSYTWLSDQECTIPVARENMKVSALCVDLSLRSILLVKEQDQWKIPTDQFDLESDDPESTLETARRIIRCQTGFDPIGQIGDLYLANEGSQLWVVDCCKEGSDKTLGEFHNAAWIPLDKAKYARYDGTYLEKNSYRIVMAVRNCLFSQINPVPVTL